MCGGHSPGPSAPRVSQDARGAATMRAPSSVTFPVSCSAGRPPETGVRRSRRARIRHGRAKDHTGRTVGHQAIGRGTVPVFFSRFDVDDVAGSDLLDAACAGRDETDSVGDVEGLSLGVMVPGGADTSTRDAPTGPWVRHDLHLLRDVKAIGKRDMDVRVPSLTARRTPAPHSAAGGAAPLQADHKDG